MKAAAPFRRLFMKNRRARRRRAVVLLLTLFVFTLLLSHFVLRNRVMLHALAPAPMPYPYQFIPSPNADERPPDTEVDCIVLHATVEPTLEGTVGIFLDPKTKVSAHFVVGKDGRVVQMVPIERRAWHAGLSVLEGRPRVNDYSVGIEMVNLNDGKDPYPDAQIQAVAGIIRFIRSRYAVSDARIVSHAQIALPPGRKSDPLGFDFDKIRALAQPIPSL